jgi:NitT/TauT family transport system ATP-binding protein
MTRPAVSGRTSAPRDAQRGVRVRDVTHIYRSNDGKPVEALKSVTVEVPPGSFVSLIGASGCGKSTLLRVIGGLLRPTTGVVERGGSVVEGPDRDVGFMFQEATLLPWRTTLQNVLLPIEIRDGRAASRNARSTAEALLETTGLAGFADSYPDELSGGMAQRAAICRMLVSDPSLLLLDEPFGALDELTRDSMNLELQRICADTGSTAIMVTHSIPEAVFLSDIVYVMSPRPGRVVEEIAIRLPRPRSFTETVTTRAYLDAVQEVRRALTSDVATSPGSGRERNE